MGGDQLAQLGQSLDGAVGVVGGLEVDAVRARRGAGDRADLGLALPEVRPGRVAHAVADLHRLVVDADDSHEGELAEGRGGPLR